ncbi:Hypp4726 [Branchiostoma lanceolatum]|uniref:Hypp4726 protein n=1 Tax=Branchiostoma lanceolatum TaxID=7740 RepID=A0A8K0AAU0_BRALA|nr:Hypp4726 [Branchiostoma lanceolatum]
MPGQNHSSFGANCYPYYHVVGKDGTYCGRTPGSRRHLPRKARILYAVAVSSVVLVVVVVLTVVAGAMSFFSGTMDGMYFGPDEGPPPSTATAICTMVIMGASIVFLIVFAIVMN